MSDFVEVTNAFKLTRNMVGAIRKNLFFGSRNVSNLPTPRVIEACKIVEAYIKEVIEEREVVA